MRKRSYKPYLILVFALFLLTSLPLIFIQKARRKCVTLCTPISRTLGLESPIDSEKERLERENFFLRGEVIKLLAMQGERNAIEGCKRDAKLYAAEGQNERAQECSQLTDLLSRAVLAHVVFREPASWSSSLWIDVGEETHPQIVAKNSPVILGRSLVGVVDSVGKRQSRVRLVTDLGLKPSVRAVRGYPQQALLVEHIDALLRAFGGKKEPLFDEAGLKELRKDLLKNLDGSYLAKGFLHGLGAPLWRKCSNRLKGVGFNYDFGDDEGPPRALSDQLLRVGDLLVTTGMDGVFPPGLRVAEVTKIGIFREGDFHYTLEALPVAPALDELQILFVMPPTTYFEDVGPWKAT